MLSVPTLTEPLTVTVLAVPAKFAVSAKLLVHATCAEPLGATSQFVTVPLSQVPFAAGLLAALPTPVMFTVPPSQ